MNSFPAIIPLRGPLDADSVFAVMGQLQRLSPEGGRVLLDCSRVTAMDPIGVNALWRSCQREARSGRRVLISELPVPLATRLRRHPITEYLVNTDELFRDPFSTMQPSER